MDEISLKEALDAIASDRQKIRTDGLRDLKLVLVQNKHTAELANLKDKEYHKILEALFRFVSIEKTAYLRGRSTSSKTQAASRLSSCASVLRTTVEISNRKIKTKTVIALVYHVTETLPCPDHDLWETLSGDYIKALRIVLEHPPHIEHLTKNGWIQVIGFCLRSLGVSKPDSQTRVSHFSQSHLLPFDDNGESRHTSVEPNSWRGKESINDRGGTADQLEACMQLLCSCSSSVIVEEAPMLLAGLKNYLLSLNNVSRSPHAAFSALNSVLQKSIIHHVSLVECVLLDIIPVVRRFWVPRSILLKGQMIITLDLARRIWPSVIRLRDTESLYECTQGLLDHLHREYIKQPERDILQLNCVTFTSMSVRLPMGIKGMAPHLGNVHSEQNWTLLDVIASFSKLLDNIHIPQEFKNPEAEPPNKKHRHNSRTTELFRDSYSSSGVEKIAALQLIPFLVTETELGVDQIRAVLGKLTTNILDSSALVSSWTMIAISSISACNAATNESLKSLWVQVWELTARCLSSPGTSRAACALIASILKHELLDYSTVMETMEAILQTIDLNGPARLTDSALLMWTLVVETRSRSNTAQTQDILKQVCSWLNNVWSFGALTDRLHVFQLAAFARPLNLIHLLTTCIGRSFELSWSPFIGPLSHISLFWLQYQLNSDLTNYLLLTDKGESLSTFSGIGQAFRNEIVTRNEQSHQIILELLQTKTDGFLQIWVPLFSDKPQHVTGEIIQILTSFCTVATVFIEYLPSPLSFRSQSVQKGVDKLWESLCNFCLQSDHGLVNTCLDVLSSLVLSIMPPFDAEDILFKTANRMGSRLLPIVNRQDVNPDIPSTDLENMDIDFPVEYSSPNGKWILSRIDRQDFGLPVFYDRNSLRAATIVQLSVMQYVSNEPGLTLSGSNIETEHPLIDCLMHLSESDILAWRYYFTAFLSCRPPISRSDACKLLESMASKCLGTYRMERCEAALSTCISMMTSLAHLWTMDERDELCNAGFDIYDWFMDVLVGKRLGSPRVLIHIAILIDKILAVSPQFQQNSSKPSPRTILFELLRNGEMTVKFHISKLISNVFARYDSSDHDAIFDDVLDNLPTDPDWNEGIALRLYLLSQLASDWNSLLRRSVYHIFETPGQIPSSASHAKICLQTVSRSLKLKEPREIFRLFSSQILHTWLEIQELSSIPYALFDYPSLQDMMRDSQDEIIGQLILRGQENEMEYVSKLLKCPFHESLTASFAKAESYSIAQDTSIPPSQNSHPPGAEGRIRAHLGGSFHRLLKSQFPLVVSGLFRCIDQPEQMERAFAKRPSFQYARDTWQDIQKRSTTMAILPPGQQPCFRARYLLDELEYLCKRTGYEFENMWTPALVCHVARSLMDTIHPALGSLHSCAVLRKLKILICITGSHSLESYPLDMLLHFLRPFLVDPHCSADAIGIFWYLMEKRKGTVPSDPSFATGLVVSTLASLRMFICSSHGVINHQISHPSFPNIQNFSNWLSEFLDSWIIFPEDGIKQSSFHELIKAAQCVKSSGSAFKGSPEGNLVLHILNDQTSGQNLLTEPARDLIYTFLFSDFQRPSDFQYDILGDDETAVKNAVAAWKCILRGPCNRSYRLWVSRCLGRAYAATGKISDSLLKEEHETFADDNLPGRSSRAIVSVLYNSFISNNPQLVGLSENCLQEIVDKLPMDDKQDHYSQAIPFYIKKSFSWEPYHCPNLSLSQSELSHFKSGIRWNPQASVSDWARDISICLCLHDTGYYKPVITPLPKILFNVPDLAERLLPYILHYMLDIEATNGCSQPVRAAVSDAFRNALQKPPQSVLPHIKLIISCILYLREMKYPDESTADKRDEWLEIDYLIAANAATKCRMYKTALLFIEIHFSLIAKISRRDLAVKNTELPFNLLNEIFQEINDPDLFYGLQRDPNLDTILGNLQYEGGGITSLSFQSAKYDANMRTFRGARDASSLEIIKALNASNMQGIASTVFSSSDYKPCKEAMEDMFSVAIYLRQWDIPVSTTIDSTSGNVFKALQGLSLFDEKSEIIQKIDDSFLKVLNHLYENKPVASMKESMGALAILTEIDEAISCATPGRLQNVWRRLLSRNHWLKFESFRDISKLLYSHEALFSLVSNKSCLKSILSINTADARLLEAESLRETFKVARDHSEELASLKSAVSLSSLVKACSENALSVDAVAKFDLANVLWDQGEMITSIHMLQQLAAQKDLHKQSISMSRAEVLATLVHHVTEARLQTPQTIIDNYLMPAADEVNKKSKTVEAGHVYHAFAKFCDQQLQNQDVLEDFKRIEQIRCRKEQELLDLDSMMNSAQRREEKGQLQQHRNKAQRWFELDDREYQRLKRERTSFLHWCLQNYLLSLAACDTYKNDALRFCALWMDNSDDAEACVFVDSHIDGVPSRRFAPLMNQLSSRLLNVSNDFQHILQRLLVRLCTEHPYHSMYQVFTSSKSRSGDDDVAISRQQAANNIAKGLKSNTKTAPIWTRLHNANVNYVRFAAENLGDEVKSGSKFPLKKSPTGRRLAEEITKFRHPPPTMSIELRADCDYSRIPYLVSYSSHFSVASGLSAPKIVTATASDGKSYKQLFKSGNDDLRQDSIMEQVFEQVSDLLREHRATQQRKLGIRTYKVLPLTTNSGVIEFVQNTIPLNDYLLPAHQMHFPRDMKPYVCRKHVNDAQSRSPDHRLRVFRQIMAHFHPVMRFFFMERFPNPDDWFSKRLAYTRSTAAISILGHVLGLGDRHGHNILLDEKTGEVVHIDLGVAFEQGRVLPIPEVVPFRLTRDLVDGMGITKTEGVFRRCCEFTLETLRLESYSIMTILDVLRYDPLYSWSLTPLRLRKLQGQQAEAGERSTPGVRKKDANEPSEADRALTVVAKKLGKSLSVTATVNELIQQATDDRNLALLFSGWAAYV